MKIKKYFNKRRFIFTALLATLLSCIISVSGLVGTKSSNALSAVPSSTTVIDPIYDFDKYCYSESALDSLAVQILGSGNNLTSLISYAKTTAGTVGQPIDNNLGIITLKYGRYRFTPQSIYKPLVWLPVYLSRSRSGDAILTLYLAATESAIGSTSQQEALQFSNGGRYSTDYSCTAPSNSYGTSHMRAINLGNVKNAAGEFVGEYAYYDADHSSYVKLYDTGEVNEANCNKFSDFIYGTNFTGLLCEDIATPAELEWQEHESSSEYLSGSYADYNWPNEAYGTPSAGVYADAVFDYATTNKTYYDRWKNDKVWLPSLTEVGTGNNGLGVTDTTDGIWKLNDSQRSNKIASWLRSANTGSNGSYSTYTMYCTDIDGSITSKTVNTTCGIRPAIHLNLSKISTKTVEPINLPETVTTTYNSEVWTADKLPADQKTWYYADDMIISFFRDENCTMPVAPIDAGTYYMMVELKISSSRYFFGENKTTRLKSAKFVVEKCKLGVEWEYENPSEESLPPPIKVTLDADSFFYERDIKAGNIPEIGMKYSNVSGAGILDSPVYPDKIGYYTATAYIIDENLHQYNYELSGKSLESKQFHVSQKRISEPVFLENDKTEIKKDYKGKQWIQINNIDPQYVTVTVDVSKTKGQTAAEQEASAAAAREKIVDLGVVNGVQTFMVEDVGEYTFTVSLKDIINTLWEDSGSDYSAKILTMTIEQAYITVTFDGLDTSWASAVSKSFDINILGIYSSGETVTLDVYYIPDSNPTLMMRVSNSTGKYVIPSGLAPGGYSIYAMLSGTSQYTSNYRMENAVYQKFEITQTVASFDSSLANWQYKISSAAAGTPGTPTGAYNEHDSASTALELDYTGDYYIFSLGMSESQLQKGPYYVKATYSGDTYVKDAGLHSVTVLITAYDKNIEFTSQTYTIYFKINKAKFNLSGVEWDTSGVGQYTGNVQSVSIKTGTLPEGLTVIYDTGGFAANGATNVGNYTTTVTFRLSDDYSANYMLPVASDSSTYTGTFNFDCDWSISKRVITASWSQQSTSSAAFFIPSLLDGDSIVDYSLEHEENGSWVPCTNVGSTTSTEKYRVTATVKSEYADNYSLTGTTSQEFTVTSGQYAVSLYFNIDGSRSDPDAQVVYKGTAFNVTTGVDGGTATITSQSVNYYYNVGGSKGTSVSSATTVGKYIAEVTSTFEVTGSTTTFTDTTLFPFEVIKADFDVSALQWQYTHGDTVIRASYNAELGKWVDNSNKEIVFSFVFDSTPHTLDLIGYVPNLEWSAIANATQTNAGDYRATFSFTYSTANYNVPDFPTALDWTIQKATINFEDVKWGYIDSYGREQEFDFKNNSFTFTRVDGQDDPVKFTVGLINLPAGVENLFTYYTTSYTDRSFGTKTGNSFSAVGEYHTYFEVNGSYSLGPNYETFTSSSVPGNLSLSQDWSITERTLTSPRYDNNWTVFDNKAHDLIALCNMPREELCYFSIEITFIDMANSISNDYTGYKDEDVTEDYYAKYAGTYLIRFYELRGDNAEKYIWGTVEIDVTKEQLEVEWDLKGTIPVARVTGIYVSEMLQTRYLNTNGGEVTSAYISTTDGVTFYAEPFITDEYARNITFIMIGDQPERYEFVSSQFTPSSSSAQLNKADIKLKLDVIEYTGSAITFEIVDWSRFSQYLYISDGKLTQTDIGRYSVRLSFIKTADAFWAGTDGERDDLDLEFRIIKPTTQLLEYPKFDNKSLIYSGMPQTFKITNWLVLKDYIYYVYNGEEYRDGDGTFTQTNAKIYSVTFYFIETGETLGYWKEDGSRNPYTLQFRIIDPNAAVTEISNPVLSATSREWTGDEQSFVITNWDEIRDYVEISEHSDGVTVNGGTLKVTDQKVFYVVVRITESGITFADGSTTFTLTFKLTASSTKVNPLAKPEFVENSKNYANGEEIEFEISNWADQYGNYDFLNIVCSDANARIEGGKIYVTAIGTYTLTVTIKEGANAKWKEDGITSYELTFTVVDPDNPLTPGDGNKVSISAPAFEHSQREFTGYEITFMLKNWDVIGEYITVKEGSLTQISVGKYAVTLSIDAARATWADGSTNDIVLTFEITKATLTMGVDEDGNPAATNGDGEKVNIGEFLEPHYYDENGNELSEKDLKDGEQYTVKYTVKDEEQFESCFTNTEEIRETVTNNTYIVTYRKPKGINWILIICIVAIVVLLILIIVTIVVIRKRRAYYYDDYDAGYDDYGDYYDDDYEDYDDYDDYDEDYYDEY